VKQDAERIAARAVWFTAPRRIEVRDVTVHAPGPGDVRIEAVASAISQGTEMLVYRGQVPADMPLDLPALEGSFDFPIKYGYALAGIVRDVGPGVADRRPGDPVFVLHPHQSAFVVPAASTVPLPSGIDPVLGVFTANLETAVNVLHDTPLRFGETVVVFGLGTVGLLVAQLLLRSGAGAVIGVDPLPLRREIAARVGLAHTLAPGAGLAAHLRDLTEGRGPDVAIEASGNGAALQVAIDAVAVEGTVVVASWYGTKPVSLDLGGGFHRGRVRLRSSQVGRLNPEAGPRWDYARRARTAAGLLASLPLREMITHRVPIDDASGAYRLVDEQPGDILQVILTYETGKGTGSAADV
jgi:2-desacetyl-2-hydroxyethyl bacteriochlorophyllide A dehydrogenase